MKKLFSLFLVLCMLMSLAGAFAESADAEAPAEAAAPAEEALSVTQHSVRLGRQTINYTATAGRMPVSVKDSHCDMFFTAYTLDGVKDPTERPVTFAFNGGPGASSEWLHMGMLSPRRVETDENGQPTQLPGRIVDNPCSILDMTHGPRMNDKTDWNRTCFNHMYRQRLSMWIPTKKSLAISTGNRYQPVRKFVSSGANFRVPFCLAQNPQILRDRLTHSCVSRGT